MIPVISGISPFVENFVVIQRNTGDTAPVIIRNIPVIPQKAVRFTVIFLWALSQTAAGGSKMPAASIIYLMLLSRPFHNLFF